jgi:hypothetical protein
MARGHADLSYRHLRILDPGALRDLLKPDRPTAD